MDRQSQCHSPVPLGAAGLPPLITSQLITQTPLATSSFKFHAPKSAMTGASLPIFTKDSENLASFSFGHQARTQNCEHFGLGTMWRGTWHQNRARAMN